MATHKLPSEWKAFVKNVLHILAHQVTSSSTLAMQAAKRLHANDQFRVSAAEFIGGRKYQNEYKI